MSKRLLMKRIFINLSILVLFLSACNSAEPGHHSDSSNSKTTLRSFTDTSKLDTFKIVLNGDKPKNMELVFTITPENGKAVYTRVLKTKELIDNYKDELDLGKEKEQVKFMEQELSLFFDEENFLEPAVTENEEADKNTPDKNFFAELKKSGLNGFKYRFGKENKVYIAWSAAEKKTKPYYECCR